jgi:hypothetical protein
LTIYITKNRRSTHHLDIFFLGFAFFAEGFFDQFYMEEDAAAGQPAIRLLIE